MRTNRSPYFVLVAALAACMFSAAAAFSQEATLVGDAYTSPSNPTGNNGSSQALLVTGSGSTGVVTNGPSNRAWFMFDISSLPAGTQAPQIAKAELMVYCSRVYAAGAVDLNLVSTAWTESAITDNSAPSVGTVIASDVPITQTGFVTFDVTAAVQAWLGGTTAVPAAPNQGLVLTASSSAATTTVVLDSKENTATGHNARLLITLSAPAGVTTLNTLSGDVTLTPGTNVSITPSGNTLRIDATGTTVGLSSVTHDATLSGDGTAAAPLSVVGGTGNFIQNMTGLQANSNFHISGTGIAGVFNADRSFNISGFPVLQSRTNIFNNSTGVGLGADINGCTGLTNCVILGSNARVGIGTNNPTSMLEIGAQDALALTGFQPFLTLRDTGSGGHRSFVQGANGDLFLIPESYQLSQSAAMVLGTNGVISLNGNRTFVAGTTFLNGNTLVAGNVGIGTNSPDAARLVVNDTSIGTAVDGTASTGTGIFGESTSSTGNGVYGRNSAFGYAMYADGNVGQAVTANGWLKASLLVNFDGSINLCYNSTLRGTASTTPPCGFNVTHNREAVYDIDFGFQVNSRYFSATTAEEVESAPGFVNVRPTAFTTVHVVTVGFSDLVGVSFNDRPFYILVF